MTEHFYLYLHPDDCQCWLCEDVHSFRRYVREDGPLYTVNQQPQPPVLDHLKKYIERYPPRGDRKEEEE